MVELRAGMKSGLPGETQADRSEVGWEMTGGYLRRRISSAIPPSPKRAADDGSGTDVIVNKLSEPP